MWSRGSWFSRLAFTSFPVADAWSRPVRLSGWGRDSYGRARIATPRSSEEVAVLLDDDSVGTVAARGLGRSYGDAAGNEGGGLIDLTALDAVLDFDHSTGRVRVGAGIVLRKLLKVALLEGWFCPVVPGTASVTLGGAFAADIHGKNHHEVGTLSAHVTGARLVSPAWEGWITPEREPEYFWASAGGMGLTGLLTEIELQLVRVSTGAMVVKQTPTSGLDSLLALLADPGAGFPYSVAWVDLLVRPRAPLRGILMEGRHAETSDVRDGATYGLESRAGFDVPETAPDGLLSNLTGSLFNELWYRRAASKTGERIESIESYFFPLDVLRNWNRLYGSRGFQQYQFVVPLGAEEALATIVRRLRGSPLPTFLAVLKKMGPSGLGHLSFPLEGWTLAVDLPCAGRALDELLDDCDRDVLEVGGRVYLAKDARMAREVFTEMYPRLEEWRAVRDRLDPDGRLSTDLGRRLGLSW